MENGQAVAMEIRVIGLPGPQGSKSFKGMSNAGHAILTESSKKVKPWREAVVWAAREAMEAGELSLERHCNGAMIGAVEVEMIFTLPKPKSAPKRRKTLPDRKPDLSKLVRSTEDALTTAGVYEDDARIIGCISGKRYPGEGPDALDVPGCVIRIRSVQ